jgi:SAM-dependent methyltransferase
MPTETEFDHLVREAQEAHFSGWDFSWLEGRWVEEPLPWDYAVRVKAAMQAAQSMLDMGTGGGELLETLAPFPPQTCATEAWPPNVKIAIDRLTPLGVEVYAITSDSQLPFDDTVFDLIINRHDSFDSRELFRTLKPGGLFITQQVGGQNVLGLNKLLQDEVSFADIDWTVDRAISQLRSAGLEITSVKEAFPAVTVYDIGAIVYYLNAIPWQIDGFSVEAYHDKLLAIHREIQRQGSITLHSHRFYIEARKPV